MMVLLVYELIIKATFGKYYEKFFGFNEETHNYELLYGIWVTIAGKEKH